ncbi:MAG: glycosyltransferase family 2 protein [Flexilinea flocculi]|jgi:dolichol-phosphate mannosyltransferase|nr:glycosyltransferase family 2 protein [Flexilinea flocculi]
MKKISIIIPVYYNEENLIPLYEDLKEKVLDQLVRYDFDYEIIFVDDGSGDHSFQVMTDLAEKDEKIVNLRLSRNFGSHAAVLAGLSVCTGCCATMKAADLQEPSEMILEMIEKYLEGNKVVLAVREGREEGFSQRFFANAYYFLVKKIALKEMPRNGFDCYLIDRKVIDVLNLMEEKNTALTGQILWSGFQRAEVRYVRKKRNIGKSRWTLGKKYKLVVDSLLGFSYFPIRFISSIGVLMFFGAFIWMVFLLINKLSGKIPVTGYTTLAILLLGGFGIVMLSLGVLGEYLWRMFDAARNRPPYIIDENSKKKDPILK